MDNNNTSKELKDVMSYMTEILINEFPTNTLTEDYLMASILDNKRSHAKMLLENCLMKSSLNDIKKYFTENIKKNSTPRLNNNINFDDNLRNILVNAEEEVDKEKNPIIGTEHVFLALLNPKNQNEKIQALFRTFGIDYSFIKIKCNEKSNKLIEIAKNAFAKNNEKNMQIPNFPLKSEINPKNLMPKNTSVSNYTIDLSKSADDGKLDDLIGRRKEINQVIQVLARRKKNNVVLVGKSGVGKTSIITGLANLIAKGEVPDVMKDKKIVQLNIAALIAGTFLRGAFEERVKNLFEEMKANGKYILFIDDMHTVLKSSSKEKDTDISSMINDVLQDGEIKIVGATSFKDYRNSIESNTMIARRLQKIIIEPMSKQDTINLIEQNKHYYEDFHNVVYTKEAIEKCVELSERYISDRCLPDSAIDIIDFSGAHTCLINRKPQEILKYETCLRNIEQMKTDMVNNGDFEGVEALLPQENEFKAKLADFEREFKNNKNRYQIEIGVDDICQSISELTNIPINKLTVDEKKQLSNIDNVLKANVVGQDDAIDKICRVIKRNKIGLGNKNKPSTFLLVGKSGVGKTLIAKKLAEQVFGDTNALVRIDMSEYSEKNSVAKLTGAAPGYVGYDNGGQLTEAVKNKQHCVLLLDEIEKADKEVYNVFLQLFDEGRLTDNSGQIVNFKNTIILMTSNVGTKRAQDFGQSIGFGLEENTNTKAIIEKEIKKRFAPEFINRIDQIVYFNDLTEDNIKSIVKLELNKVNENMQSIKFNITYNDDVVALIANECSKNREFGARPILRFIQNNVEDVITDLILQGDYTEGYTFILHVADNVIKAM